MLPAAHRMRRSRDIDRTVRTGARAGRPRLVVHLLDAGTPETTAAFAVSKAVGTAVVRNQVKRRLRHLVAARLDLLPAGSGLVVRALAPAAGATSAELATDLDRALRTAARRSGEAGR